MKRVLCLFLSLTLILTIIFVPSAANAETYGNLRYKKFADYVEITECDSSVTSIDIPAEIDGLPVTIIGDHAFYKCLDLTDVNIPSSVTGIGEYAFYKCSNLTKIDIPNGVTSIGYRAFYGCSNLKSINLPDNISKIGENAFYLTAFYENEENWSDNALYVSNYLIVVNNVKIGTEYTIRNGTSLIADGAFNYCYGLTSVNIPESVTGIGVGAFSLCGSLNIEVSSENSYYTSIDGVLFSKDKTEIAAYAKDKIQPEYTVPSGVTSIGDRAFYECENLTNINILGSVESIGNYAFYNCDKLTGLEIPNSTTSIGSGAFCDCSGLKRIRLSDNLKRIDSNAFLGCTHLEGIKIPESVTSIGDYALSGCIKITSINLPNNLTSISNYLFSECYSLNYINIPNSITSIGDAAFYGCDSISHIYYGGSEEQWNNINVGTDNEDLTSAAIYFNSCAPMSASIVSKTAGAVTVITNLDNFSDGDKAVSKVYAALYDKNGAVIDSYSAEYNGADIKGVLKSNEKADHIKVFVWNKDESLTPITDAPEYISL